MLFDAWFQLDDEPNHYMKSKGVPPFPSNFKEMVAYLEVQDI